MVPILLSTVIGSVSFWGSNIAFGKLQGLIPGQPVKVPGQQILNAVLLVGIIAACIVLCATNDDPSQGLFIAVLIAAALLGNLVVLLPIGGADMPVVIALLNAFTGLAAAGAGFTLDNVALIVAGTLVGSSGTILTLEMATAMNCPSPTSCSRVRCFCRRPPRSGEERPHRSISAQDAAISLSYARLSCDRSRVRDGGRPGPARRQGDGRRAGAARGGGELRDPRSPGGCRGT